MRADNLASILRQRIELQSLSQTANGAGGFSESWNTDSTVWAMAEPLSGREIYDAEQTEDRQIVIFTTRYQTGINAKMRIKFNNEFYNIRSVINPQFKNQLLEILAEKVGL